MYPNEKRQQRSQYHPEAENPTPTYSTAPDLPPPSYDSHYASSSSSSAQAPKPLTPPEKPIRTADLIRDKDNLYSAHPSPASPVGSVVPFPHPAFAAGAGPSTVMQPSKSNFNALSRSSSFAVSRGVDDHKPSSSTASLASGSGSSSNPTQTAPPSFLRSPPRDLPYTSFPPIALYTTENSLGKGFPRIAPETIVNPHPFTTHDIREEDWYWFLSAVKGAAAAAGTDFTSIPGVTPVATHLAVSMGLGRLVNMGIEAHVKSKKNGPIAEVFDSWNQHFFHPRQLDVVLARGRFCYSGSNEGLPPDMLQKHGHQYNVYNQDGHVSDDDYSSDDSHPERTARRREKRAARKERRSQRREQRKDFICASENKWRLVVSYKPVVLA